MHQNFFLITKISLPNATTLTAMMIMSKFPWFFMLLILCTASCIPAAASDDNAAYAKSLLKFKESLTNTEELDASWQELEPNVSLCSDNKSKWNGVRCRKGVLTGLRLENMRLGGKIDVDSLAELPLFSLSVRNNSFSGPFPGGINRLGQLRRLFLGINGFSGEISDDAFLGMKSLWQVELGSNLFGGEIPLSLMRVPKLSILDLRDNRFQGRIPEFSQVDLKVNFSNNKLRGPIPESLNKLNSATSFLGNANLCGAPLAPCKPKHSIKKMAFIVGAIICVALALLIMVFLACRRRSQPLGYEKSVEYSQTIKEAKDVTTYKNSEHGKIQFVKNDRERFELEDLLKASAEVLGSGSFGSSYKAVLVTGKPYVVRRFRQMNNAGRDEFYEHMRRLGRLSHRNLLPLVGFYYRKEEKLLVTDFVQNGSLASHLHGKKRGNEQGLDWSRRLKIIKGVARGLSHLYKELPSLTLPHGHLKSSNVLLDSTYDPILADYALSPLINKDHAQQFMVAYKSPESMHNDRVTRKTDVWSLGILILELLTGRFPANYLKKGRGPSSDLATWVNSVVREEWTGEVFDKEMKSRNGEGEMLRLLKIGMCCCEWDVEKRWDLEEARDRIEELKERDSDHDQDCYSSSMSEGADMYSSMDEDFSFSKAS